MTKKNWGAYIYVSVLACLVAGSGAYIWNIDRGQADNTPNQVYYLDEYFEAEGAPSMEAHAVDEKDVLTERSQADSSEEVRKASERTGDQISDDLGQQEVSQESEFLLSLVDGHVMVYRREDMSQCYMSTGITVEELPAETIKEIEAGKEIWDEEALYFFLESYSS